MIQLTLTHTLMAALVSLMTLSTSTWVWAQDRGTIAADEAKEELRQFGEGLKAAVASRAMSRQEARSLWKAASVAHRLEFGSDKNDSKKTNDTSADTQKENPDHNPRSRISRLVPPWPGQLTELLHPQFLVRSAQLLGDHLDLYDEQIGIIEMILVTYESTWEETTAPLRDAMDRYRNRGDRQTLQTAVEHLDRELDLDDIDPAAAANRLATDRVDRAQARRNKKDQLDDAGRSAAITRRTQEIQEWLTPRLQNMADRVAEVRNRIQHRLMIISQSGDVATTSDIVALAENLRQQRTVLENDVLEMITLTVVMDEAPESSRRLTEELDRLRIDDGYRFGRVGGESIRPWGVLADTFRGKMTPREATEIARTRGDELADLVRRRNVLSIDREIQGWRFLVRRDELISEHGRRDAVPREKWMEALEEYVTAWQSQIKASVAYRDALLDLVQETTLSVSQTDHPLSDRYHINAMRMGFALEMKPRWVELAMDTALAVEDLDPETLAELLELDLEVRKELADIRGDAIGRRMVRDPELAMTDVIAFWGKNVDRSKAYTDEDWRGFAHDRHATLADRTWRDVQSLLTDDQFAAVPERPEKETSKETSKDK